MEFMTEYKRLDNLCRDLFNSDAGVTSYIKEMEKHRPDTQKIQCWNSDYQHLKHYRYIRNQIAHDNGADEDTLCDESDVLWIDDFYQRILCQEDALARYNNMKKANTPNTSDTPKPGAQPQYKQTAPKKQGCLMCLIICAGIWLIPCTLLAYTLYRLLS